LVLLWYLWKVRERLTGSMDRMLGVGEVGCDEERRGERRKRRHLKLKLP
jgi:hypothetical protein